MDAVVEPRTGFLSPRSYVAAVLGRKKSSFLSGRATIRGGGLNGCVIKEKRTFFNDRKNVPMALSVSVAVYRKFRGYIIFTK